MRKRNTTRRMLQNVRVAGFMEKMDLKENFINHAYIASEIGRVKNPGLETLVFYAVYELV